MKAFFLRATLLIILISAVVLGYGYWHSVTHASFNVTMSLKDRTGDGYHAMPLAEIYFLDATGELLATGIADEKHNFVHLLHPEVGDCHELEKFSGSRAGKTAWQECFAIMSTWIPEWAEQVKAVDVVYQGQTYANIPLKVSAYNSGWPYWWVPLPHIGGKPYTYYRARITVNMTE